MKKAGKPFKIIVDSNIWISFLIGKSLKGLQNYIDARKVLIITCTEQIQELAGVFQKPKIKRYFTADQGAEFFELLDESSVYVDLKTKTNLCRDIKDNYLLSLAIDSNADFLITGDNDLLVLENVKKTRIVKFTEFENSIKL
ncbi:MAG TPA: putative toxin-antitoxin system toxin component, PIN family [Mariniphaga anaerophila]|uniref:Toxin-antitoxin system toxin component, PIN family n=1 Tax=Mariniphaga anaerophila TaxID=1484053 RepID=A0A831PLB5_9BACT|nr:putative toxin-antitoxin system toxin component, PIN family [Mariniphaga anaerophila]